MLLPDTVPDTVPVPFAPLPLSVIDIVPENDVPDWVSAHVIRPGPDESVAVPDHNPLTLELPGDGEGLEGVAGVELPPPPQPAAASARSAPARTPENRVRIMVKLCGF
jgi:hypothetical protein